MKLIKLIFIALLLNSCCECEETEKPLLNYVVRVNGIATDTIRANRAASYRGTYKHYFYLYNKGVMVYMSPTMDSRTQGSDTYTFTTISE